MHERSKLILICYNSDAEGVILIKRIGGQKCLERVHRFRVVIPVEIFGFTTHDLWTFLARREANLLVIFHVGAHSYIFVQFLIKKSLMPSLHCEKKLVFYETFGQQIRPSRQQIRPFGGQTLGLIARGVNLVNGLILLVDKNSRASLDPVEKNLPFRSKPSFKGKCELIV